MIDQRDPDKPVDLTHPDKVLFPDTGVTKADLLAYYETVADVLLDHIHDRPLTLQRFPRGINADGFFQQNRSHFPDRFAGVRLGQGCSTGTIDHVLCNDVRTLRYLVNLDTITIHAWLSRWGSPSRPDQIVFDLDPPDDGFDAVRRGADHLRRALERAGLTPFVKTTGSRGVHVVAPLCPRAGFDRVRSAARGLAERLVRAYPDQLTLEHRKVKRGGRLYLDVLRNAFGQTAVAPYGVRARPGAPVATPLDWPELADPAVGPRSFTVANLPARLRERDDPWSGMQEYAVSVDRLEYSLGTEAD